MKAKRKDPPSPSMGDLIRAERKTRRIRPPVPPASPGLSIERLRLEDLKLDEANTNRHDQRGLEGIKASLKRFGQQKPIVVDGDNVVRAGNGCYQAARALGWTHIDAVRTKLAGNEKKAWAHADNRTARFSKDDDTAVASLLIELRREDASLIYASGYTEQEEDKLLHAVEKAGTPIPEDDMPELPRKPVAQLGDLWELGPHRLVCGDATNAELYVDLMKAGPGTMDPAHCVFTDPPYGVAYDNQKCGPGRPKRLAVAGDKAGGNELVDLVADALRRCCQIALPTAAFYIWHASTTRDDFARAMKMAGLEEQQYLIWAKTNHVLSRAHYHWAHEPCFYASKAGQTPAWHGDRAQMSVWKVGMQGRTGGAFTVAGGVVVLSPMGEIFITDRRPKGKKGLRVVRLEEGGQVLLDGNTGAGTLWEVQKDHLPEHPTAKPVELARRALANSTKRGDIVLDPFLGGGCTLLACEQMGRICRAVELEPAYVDVAVKRWQRLTGNRARCADRPEATIA